MAKPKRGWLALSRKAMESVVVVLPDGREVWLLVTAVGDRPGSVRLGVHAPSDCRILRSELYEGKSSDE